MGKNPAYFSGVPNRPVEQVTWTNAVIYCERLTASQQSAGVLPAGWAYRLPTEAEWEYVARAGTTTAYWWGDAFDPKYVRQREDRDDGEKRRSNPWGLIDVTGGVWEWTASVFKAYPFVSDGRDDPRAPGKRAVRGGASTNGAQFLRLANRNSAEPNATSESVGFRCVQ